MCPALNGFYASGELLPTVRALLSRHPEATVSGAEELAVLLRAERLVSRCAEVHEIEAVLEALVIEGEVVA